MMLYPKNEDSNSESGQTFVEFIFLLAVLVTISYGLLAGINSAIGERWRGLVHIVTRLEASDKPELQ